MKRIITLLLASTFALSGMTYAAEMDATATDAQTALQQQEANYKEAMKSYEANETRRRAIMEHVGMKYTPLIPPSPPVGSVFECGNNADCVNQRKSGMRFVQDPNLHRPESTAPVTVHRTPKELTSTISSSVPIVKTEEVEATPPKKVVRVIAGGSSNLKPPSIETLVNKIGIALLLAVVFIWGLFKLMLIIDLWKSRYGFLYALGGYATLYPILLYFTIDMPFYMISSVIPVYLVIIFSIQALKHHYRQDELFEAKMEVERQWRERKERQKEERNTLRISDYEANEALEAQNGSAYDRIIFR